MFGSVSNDRPLWLLLDCGLNERPRGSGKLCGARCLGSHEGALVRYTRKWMVSPLFFIFFSIAFYYSCHLNHDVGLVFLYFCAFNVGRVAFGGFQERYGSFILVHVFVLLRAWGL